MKQPETGDKFFTKTTHGGLNDAVLGNEPYRLWEGSVLPNCVGAAQGCFNKKYSELKGQDKLWWKYLNCTPSQKYIDRATKQGLKVGNKPKANSLLVWQGHVAFVDEVKSDNEIVLTESSWSGKYIWRTRTATNKNGRWGMAGKYTVLGFIYMPEVKQPVKEPEVVVEVKEEVIIEDKKDDKVYKWSETIKVVLKAFTDIINKIKGSKEEK